MSHDSLLWMSQAISATQRSQLNESSYSSGARAEDLHAERSNTQLPLPGAPSLHEPAGQPRGRRQHGGFSSSSLLCCRSPARINTLRCSSPSDMQRHLCFPDTSSTFHEWQKQSSHNPETVPRVIRRSGLSSGICHKHRSSAGPRNHAQQPANRAQASGESVKVSNRSWGCSWCRVGI